MKHLIIITTTFLVLCNAYPHAEFSHHQYAILDSTLTFSAKIIEPNHDKFTIYWTETVWNPNPSAAPRTKTQEMSKENNYQSDWQLEFPAKDFHPGNYTITANIMYDWAGFYPLEFATSLLTFTLTDGFTGKMVVNNVTKHRKNKTPFLVSTKNVTEIKIDVDNPELLKSATNVTWLWFNNQTNIANTTEPLFSFNFTEVKTYEINARLDAVFNNTIKPNATITKHGNFGGNITAKGKK